MIGQLVRVKSLHYPRYWDKPNLFICDRINEDWGFAYLSFADGDKIPSGCFQGAFLNEIELVTGQLSLF